MSSYTPEVVEYLNLDAEGLPVEPVSVNDLRSHARVDFDSGDSDLAFWIRTAREMLEAELGRAIVWQRLRFFFDCFPSDCSPLELPWPPVISVENLYWTDSSLATYTWYANSEDLIEGSPGTTRAHVDTHNEPGRLVTPFGDLWPATTLKSANPIRVDYTAGYPTVAAVPYRLKQAIRLIVTHWYENRSAVVLGKAVAVDSKALAVGVQAVCAQLRMYGF